MIHTEDMTMATCSLSINDHYMWFLNEKLKYEKENSNITYMQVIDYKRFLKIQTRRSVISIVNKKYG